MVSPDVAIAKALIYEPARQISQTSTDCFAEGLEQAKMALFESAIATAQRELNNLFNAIEKPEQVKIFQAHLVILGDEELFDAVLRG